MSKRMPPSPVRRLFLALARPGHRGRRAARQAQDEPPLRLKKKKRDEPPKAGEPGQGRAGTSRPRRRRRSRPKAEDGKEGGRASRRSTRRKSSQRITKNMQAVEEKLAKREVGDGTRQTQDDILKDIDLLLGAEASHGGGGAAGAGPAAGPGPEPAEGRPAEQVRRAVKSKSSAGKQSGQPGSKAAAAARGGKSSGGTSHAAGAAPSGASRSAAPAAANRASGPAASRSRARPGQEQAKSQGGEQPGRRGRHLHGPEEPQRRPVQGRLGPSARVAAGRDERLLQPAAVHAEVRRPDQASITGPSPNRAARKGD